MTLLQDVKKSTQRITGRQRPASGQIAGLLRRAKRGMFRFRDDGKIPNHPRWPVIVYWNAVQMPRTLDPAAIMEELFKKNGWGDSCRNGIYDYCTIIRAFTKYLASPAAAPRFGSAVTAVALSSSTPAIS
jgi:hypothetical protein